MLTCSYLSAEHVTKLKYTIVKILPFWCLQLKETGEILMVLWPATGRSYGRRYLIKYSTRSYILNFIALWDEGVLIYKFIGEIVVHIK